MAETSRSQVTITLGRSGQVVKRGAVLDSSSEPEPIPPLGTKRSVRDRLGGGGGAHNINNKRLREDNGRWNLDDLGLTKDDLRFKIMKRAQSDSMVDLRDMLSRPARPSTANSYSMHGSQRVLQPRHERPDPREDGHRPRWPVSRDDRSRGLVSNSSQRTAEPIDGRQGMPEVDDVRPRVTERPMTGQSSTGLLRGSYSPWTLDHIRRKSPDARGICISPQRRRAYEDTSDNSRPVAPTSLSFLSKQPPSVDPMGATPTIPPRGNMQPRQYPGGEAVTVEGFLRWLGLEKYLISFKVEEVDMSALSQMGDRDLKELGIPMGPRKKILLALLARGRIGSARQAR